MAGFGFTVRTFDVPEFAFVTCCWTVLDAVIAAKFASPAYWTVIGCVPTTSELVVNVAVPLFAVTVPMLTPLS